jgi:hypothetical protein
MQWIVKNVSALGMRRLISAAMAFALLFCANDAGGRPCRAAGSDREHEHPVLIGYRCLLVGKCVYSCRHPFTGLFAGQ